MIPEKPSGPHPDAGDLRRAYLAPSDPDARDVLSHAALCASCSAELAAIEAFESLPADPFGADARRSRAAWAKFNGAPAPRASFGVVPAFALAAVVCLVAGLAVFLPRREADVLRGGEALRGSFSPSGEIAAPPVEFLFPRRGAASVRVSVFDAERSYVWTSPPSASGESVPFPEAERGRLRPGTTYTWIVLGDGEVLPARTFTLRP